MNKKLITIVSAFLIALFIFMVPVIPATSLCPSVAHLCYYNYYKSISIIFFDTGTSYYKGILYLRPIPLNGF